MKKITLKKITAALCAVLMLAAMAGCSENNNDSNNGNNSSDISQTQQGEDSTVTTIDLGDDFDQEAVMTSRALEEGDDYAINKINNITQGDTLPGGYSLQDYSEENQGKLYNNGKSKIVIRAYNYKEDLQDMAIWADNACAMILIANITKACETVFEDPENVKVCGFDGIRYDYDIIQNDFIADENDPDAEPVKTEIYRYKARGYYFYSDQDAYVISFDTMEEDWEEQVKNFEEFVADLEVTKTEY
ncbi:MAG: hypothetical protein K2H23_04735 [Oscillospiraceae bacterium]|nr:hypothetical protein [Oscillospiraceae bacterium]